MRAVLLLAGLVGAGAAILAVAAANGGGYTIVGWNNLGMHCMDSDYSVFSILPPYNTFHAQLMDSSGKLITNASGITVTYEAVADSTGAINTTSAGKTNFWDWVLPLYGASPPVDAGLAGNAMPGPGNTPRPMTFDPAMKWFIAEGVPVTPYSDNSGKNYYPMMQLTARDGAGQVLATTKIVLPVSDEMDCKVCHASGSPPAAEPKGGWINDPDAERDYRLNILLRHDDLQKGTQLFQNALATLGDNPAGLYATVVNDNRPILCASCHGSNALPGTGLPGITPLTNAMHGYHAAVTDPTNGMTLDASANRSACYRCHPGSTTKCLRGAMGAAVASDGSLEMQCQSCHGSMSLVGASTRQGWFEEPDCQSCHTGTALNNNGQIRYTSAFTAPGLPRMAVDQTFATNQNAPAPGLSLYRFSYGHGGLACDACHGSTHAEYPASHVNDNVQNIALQGHAGPISECTACHGTSPSTTNLGPHGMHPVGQPWVNDHPHVAENQGSTACATCHGTDYRGTVLSRSLADRTLSTKFGAKVFWRGFNIGCYACHNGPGNESNNKNNPPVVTDGSYSTPTGMSDTVMLAATDKDKDPLTLRIVSQPQHGTAGLLGTQATYYPDAGYSGADAFTFAASDGQSDSNLGTIHMAVGSSGCSLTCSANAPASWPQLSNVLFNATAMAAGCTGTPSYSWNFGDGSTANVQNPTHAYQAPGTFTWILNVSVTGASCSDNGTIQISLVAPQISAVGTAKGGKIKITGANFHPSLQVSIAGTPWTNLKLKSSTKVTLKGGKQLKSLFPADTFVPITLTNPDDGGTVSVEFNMTTNAWRIL